MEEIISKIKAACEEYEDYRSEFQNAKESVEKDNSKQTSEQIKKVNRDLEDPLGLITVKKAIRYVKLLKP